MRGEVRIRTGELAFDLSEGEFKYLRAILVARGKEGEQFDKEQVKRDFTTLPTPQLFAKYGGARHIVDNVDTQLGSAASKSSNKLVTDFNREIFGRNRNAWKASFEQAREQALEAAIKAPEGTKAEVAKKVFNLHYNEQRRALTRTLEDRIRRFDKPMPQRRGFHC